jgi:ubiquitin thioesterase protein OTUB1
MVSLTHYVVQMCGHTEWTFEDMRDECLELLKEIEEIVHLGPQSDSNSLILDRFNDAGRSNAIVYWFRLLASAWLKGNASAYENFIPDLIGVENYCKDFLEPPNTEIEHVGVTLLIEALLKPINVSTEIVYLDRSEGNQVNSHIFPAENAAPGGPTIHLLYRPGHYDILYKEPRLQQHELQHEILAKAAEQSNLAVHRASSFSQQLAIQSTGQGYGDMSILAQIPFFSGPTPSHHGLYNSESSFEPTPAASYSMSNSISNSISNSPGTAVSPTSPLSPVPSAGPATFPSTSLPIHPHSLSTESTQSQFRPSKYEFETDWNDVSGAPVFQTSTFKNSHYNTAHYNNPNFQPEAWTPDCEEALGKPTQGKARNGVTMN